MKVTRSTHASYREQGFAVVGRVLDPATRRRLCDALDEHAPLQAEAGPYGVLRNNLRCELITVAELVNLGELAAAASALIGSADVVLFQDNLVWKPPGARRIEWHQDYSYWPLDSPRGVTFWLALDDADEENGCLSYIPGSHHLGERQPADFITGTGQPARPGLPPLNWADREQDAVSVSAAAGELLVHDPLVWHMSGANASTRHRRALTFSWIGGDVRWDPAHAPHPFNLRLAPSAGAAVRGELFPQFTAAGPGV
jgi:hypothetical protein